MMHSPLSFLEERLARLGNHYQKYLVIIRRFYPELTRALERSGILQQVHLTRASFSPAEEMKLINRLSQDEKTRIHFLSCYYALQFLFMNLRYLDILSLGVAANKRATDIYHQFMMNIGADFRTLTTAYINSLLDIYLPQNRLSEFFICSVGTRSDQDDIDVGIISCDQCDVDALNNAFSKITQHMLVYATPLHLYLSEQVGHQHYTTTISEYQRLLQKRIQNVVIISELLNARLMLGNIQLFEEFNSRVLDRYYYQPDKDMRYHEGFLRGILGEARAMLITPTRLEIVAPKYDGLRLLKSLLYAQKTIRHVPEVNAWDIIQALLIKDPAAKSFYNSMFAVISFFEMFKFLMQQFIMQEETFRLDEIDPEQLDEIASRMGYIQIGKVNAWDQLILDYYRNINETRLLADSLIEDINQHLVDVSGMVRIIDKHGKTLPGSLRSKALMRQLFHTARFFTGVKYWEDVLDYLSSHPQALKNLIVQFESLDKANQQSFIDAIARISGYTQVTVIRLLTLLGKEQQNIPGETLFTRLNNAYLKYIIDQPASLDRLCRIFSYYPHYIHEYLQILPEKHLFSFNRLLTLPLMADELREYQRRLVDLYYIHKCSSKYFQRFFNRILMHYPQYLKFFDDSARLERIARGLLAMVNTEASIENKKKILGDYHDLEFLRIGMDTMRGASLTLTNYDFTELSDSYLKKLFDICLEETNQECDYRIQDIDNFALFTTGGHGRGEAYDDDYDLIAILNSEDEESRKFAVRIISRMNREIARRGLLPHYRLGEILGSYVCMLSQVIGYFSSSNKESFIDLSQFLGARLIIGSLKVEKEIYRQIVERFIFGNKVPYIKQMISEVRNRQKIWLRSVHEGCNIKESKGGLRDIEAIMLILKAYLELAQPNSQNLFATLKERLMVLSPALTDLAEAASILRHMRNMYRIIEAAEDSIHPDHLTNIAQVCLQTGDLPKKNPEEIYAEIINALQKSAAACDYIIQFIEKILWV